MGERSVSDDEVSRCYWEAVRERLVVNSRSSFRDFVAGYRSVTSGLVDRARLRAAVRARARGESDGTGEWRS